MAHPSVVYEKQSAHPHQHNLSMPNTYTPLSTLPGMSASDKKPRVSRLELMKQNYAKKRQKDLEEKLAELRTQQERSDSGKSSSSGTVRAFFAERRALEATKRGQQDPTSLPPIGLHFKKMKSNQGPVVPRLSQKKENKPAVAAENVPVSHGTHPIGNRGMVKYHRKKSKGIDKQNPLPPLQQRPSNPHNHKPPTPNRRYETHNTLISDEAFVSNHLNLNVEQDNIVAEKEMVNIPHPPKNPKPSKSKRPTRPVHLDESEVSAEEEDNDGWSSYSEGPQPNLSKVKALRMKRLSQQKISIRNPKQEKPTEFQKWQMQQDEERRERLENHRNKNQLTEDSGDKELVTLSMRERELLEKIKAEQDKLNEIKKMQQELEEQEKFERESTITPQMLNGNKRKMENKKEEGSFGYAPKQLDKTPTPVKKASPVPWEIPTQEEDQEHSYKAPKKSKPRPKPQIIQLEQDPDEQDQEPRDNFVSFYEQAGEEAEEVTVDLSPCSICGRKFATERLSKHQVVCQKNSNNKRKKFDTRKQRASGMDHESYVLSGKYMEETPKAKKADWRVQHENFIKTIRYAKCASDEPPPVIENPHYVACPYCERKFNPETAERHIPRCKDIKARPAPPKKDKQRRKR